MKQKNRIISSSGMSDKNVFPELYETFKTNFISFLDIEGKQLKMNEMLSKRFYVYFFFLNANTARCGVNT